jgi:hypothetical protein
VDLSASDCKRLEGGFGRLFSTVSMLTHSPLDAADCQGGVSCRGHCLSTRVRGRMVSLIRGRCLIASE